MLSDEGLRLFDFGLSESTSPRLRGLARLKRDRFAAWSPAYAAPELLEGGRPTYAADVYALGCVLYELATGEHPYLGRGAVQGNAERLGQALRRPTQLPRGGWLALRQALSIKPVDRSITATELLGAFQRRKLASYFIARAI